MTKSTHAFERINRILAGEDKISTVFTLLSDSTKAMIARMEDEWATQFDVIHTRHEQAAVAMADGYARAGAGIGVCVIGEGPAIAQTGTALVGARKRGSEMLGIVASPPLSKCKDKGAKRFAQQSFLEAIMGQAGGQRNRYGEARRVMSIGSADTVVSDVTEALRRLKLGQGPVILQIPEDILHAQLPDQHPVGQEPIRELQADAQLVPSDAAIESVVDKITGANLTRPPVILVGRGAVHSGAKEAIYRLADETRAVLATTLQAKGYVSDYPFSLGFAGGLGSEAANQHISKAELILALGCSLNPYTTNKGRLFDDAEESSVLIQVDKDPASLGQFVSVDLGIVGDIKETTRRITQSLAERHGGDKQDFRSSTAKGAGNKTSRWESDELADGIDSVDPRKVVETFDAVLPPERLVLTDAGHHFFWVMDGIETQGPNSFIWTADFAAVGQGLPIAIGAARASPQRTTALFCGDGGLLMTLSELETAARHEIPLIVVVLNDQALGVEYHRLKANDEYADSAVVRTPNIADVAASLGTEAYGVANDEELNHVAEQMPESPDGPVVIDCKINRDIKHARLS